MTLAQLRMLLAVIEQGGFSKAALEMDLSQATVSEAIRELERELGQRLLERGRFGARPTEVGAKVAEEARWMLRGERSIREIARSSRGQVAGQLGVAVFQSVASYLLPQVLQRLAGRFPDIRPSLVEVRELAEADRHISYRLFESLRDGRAEVAFAQFPLPDGSDAVADLLCWPLFEEEYVAVVADSLLADLAVKRFDARLFQRAPLLANPGATCGRAIVDHLQRHWGASCAVQTVGDDLAMVRMAAQGLGIGLLPRLAVGSVGDGVSLHPLEPRLTRTVVAAIRPADLKRPTVRAFLWALGAFFPEAGLPELPSALSRPAEAVGTG